MAEFIESIPSEREDLEKEDGSKIYKISNYPADFTLRGLYDKWNNGEGDIVIPPFQRKFVWSITQASKLIESFLLGLPVPSIFLYKEKDSQKLLVIDGQQRLQSVFAYFNDIFPDTKKPFYLKNVNKKWDNTRFSELEPPDKRRLNDSVLRAVIIEQLYPNDNTSIFQIFQRLNSGGTTLQPQEIRNCIYQGELNNLLLELNQNKAWRKIINLPSPDKRLRDIELILRFLALYKHYETYKKPMKDFLSNFMKDYLNKSEEIKQFKTIFETTVSLINEKLDKPPFKIKTGLNAAVFDSIMVAFALNYSKIPDDIRSRHKILLKDEEYLNAVYKFTTDEKFVKQRIEIAERKLFK
jgi:uncharacterized protein with ParB-like and HNH nuclease domain